jgi:hypothetical protein
MVPSSAITVIADNERLTCGGFSLSETVRLRNFEFIADYFGGLSLSPRRGDSDATFMSSTRNGTPSPQRAMIEDFSEKFLMASSREGGFVLPSPRRHGTGAPPAPITTTPWMENAPVTLATMTVPPWTAAAWMDTDLPVEQRYTHQGGSKCKPMLSGPSPSKRQRHSEASSPASKPLPRSSRTRHRDTSPRLRRRRS